MIPRTVSIGHVPVPDQREPCPRCGNRLGDGLRYGPTPKPLPVSIRWECGWESDLGESSAPTPLVRRPCRWCGERYQTADPTQQTCSETCSRKLGQVVFRRRGA